MLGFCDIVPLNKFVDIVQKVFKVKKHACIAGHGNKVKGQSLVLTNSASFATIKKELYNI